MLTALSRKTDNETVKKNLWLVCFLLTSFALFADEVFESKIFGKEIQETYGSGTLSVATDVYSISVKHNDAFMKIEIPKKVFDALKLGDLVRITFVKGVFYNEIKGIALLQGAKK